MKNEKIKIKQKLKSKHAKNKSINQNKTKRRPITKRNNMKRNVSIKKYNTFIQQNKNKSNRSYSPTVNKDLITLKSIPRKELLDCNMEAAFKLQEPLQIGIPGYLYGKSCFDYSSPESKRFLLKNLSADKHVNIQKIIPPIQIQSNCWFNAMFVTFFVSDKGRKFFHFLRQLMIEGKQTDGTIIPGKLRDAFALLNFGVDACLTGNKYAYQLNTNSIIHLLYNGIPQAYKQKYPSIVDIDEAGNPLLYYIGIINYLNNSAIKMLFIRDANNDWKDKVTESVTKMKKLPHIIVLEVYDDVASEFNNKPLTFTVNQAKYQIDSAVVRDISKQHFCATITGEGKQYGYDGMSFHRIVPLDWKNKLNADVRWQFEGTKDYDGTPLQWNFTKSYQLLLYYRVN